VPVARTHSIALVGVEGYPVEIESDIQNGLPGLLLVGLPDTALREARDRIRAAIVNSHEQWPQRRITVGLSPAILAAAGAVPWAALDGVTFLGELGLDGRLRPVRGVLPAMAAAARAGFGRAVVAQPNAAEGALVPGLRVAGAPTLAALLAWLRGEQDAAEAGMAGPRPAWAPRRAAGRCRHAPGRTSPRCSASRPPGGQQRSAPLAATTYRCSGRRALARQCWPNGFPPSCPRWTRRPRWRSPRSIPWPGRCPPGARS
jgi:hypothetical protein